MDPFFWGFTLSIFSLFLLLMNAFLFSLKMKKRNKLYKTVTAYLVILFFVELLCNLIGYLKPGENSFLSHFYFNSQFLLLSIFFRELFIDITLKKIVIVSYVTITLLITAGYVLNPKIFWQFNLFEIVSTSALLVIYGFIHLFNTLNNKKEYFYFSIGLILYLICSSLIFMSGNYQLVFIEDPYIDIWIFNTFFYILFQFLIFKEWLFINKVANNGR
ncbi:hypothetical protein C7447_101119 [Tenacibaculum adriaticum]|uniref:YhhN-like protein n=2 Tax=Tenacibaculum adriaticum TaxID=413713 RepID=A0A5S5DY41_9FLAO|nr:hypothetical protein C7447_101119 [Tenacibaculum adriaticum]